MTVTPSITASDLMSLLQTRAEPTVVDVRRNAAYREDPFQLPGAKRGDPEQVSHWAPALPSGLIIVYCVHGHEVSQGTASWLIQHGYDARYLTGGIEGWRHAGFPLASKIEG